MHEGWKAERVSRKDEEPYRNLRNLNQHADLLDLEGTAAVDFDGLTAAPPNEVETARRTLHRFKSKKSWDTLDGTFLKREIDRCEDIILRHILQEHEADRAELFEAIKKPGPDTLRIRELLSTLRNAVLSDRSFHERFSVTRVESEESMRMALHMLQAEYSKYPHSKEIRLSPASYVRKNGDPEVTRVYHWIPKEHLSAALTNGLLPGFLTGKGSRGYVYAHLDRGSDVWPTILTNRPTKKFVELEIEFDPDHTYMWLLYAANNKDTRVSYHGDQNRLVPASFIDLSTQVAARLRADENVGVARHFDEKYFSSLLGRDNPDSSHLSPYNWEESEVLLDFVQPQHIRETGNNV